MNYFAMNSLSPLADAALPGGANPQAWLPVVLLLIIAIGFAVANVALSIMVGPGRTGKAKETTYESGMVPVGDARRRFNVRFYIVAMIFLVFDVDIIFFYPWATIFAPAVRNSYEAPGGGAGAAILLEMILFVGILLVAYLYAWGKGVFRWD
jgi:NADH-quinone oxidoreductase subunit A